MSNKAQVETDLEIARRNVTHVEERDGMTSGYWHTQVARLEAALNELKPSKKKAEVMQDGKLE